MNEHVILCKNYEDMDITCRYIKDNIRTDYIRVPECPPSRHTFIIHKENPLKLLIMTKAYYDSMFKYGYRGKVSSSKNLEKVLRELED